MVNMVCVLFSWESMTHGAAYGSFRRGVFWCAQGQGFQKPLRLVMSRHKKSQPHYDGRGLGSIPGSEKVVLWSDVSIFLSTESPFSITLQDNYYITRNLS